MSGETALYFAQFPKHFDRLQAALFTVQRHEVERPGQFEDEISNGPCLFYREIIFTEPEILIAPESDEYTANVIIIAENHTVDTSKFCAILDKFSMKKVQDISLTRNLFMQCFEFVVKHRLAPFWNKVGPYYVKGRGFLQEQGKLDAIEVAFSLTDKITVAVKASQLKLPPISIVDCGIAPNIMQKFDNSNSFIIHGHSLDNNKCFVLPSLKTGYITQIARGNMQTFDFKKYWKLMYGVRLPDACADDVYFTVRFPYNSKDFLYPSYCIRSRQPLVYLRCDHGEITSSFIVDLSSRLSTLCGSPLKFTSSSLFPTKVFSSASSSRQTNLSRTANVSNASQMFVCIGEREQRCEEMEDFTETPKRCRPHEGDKPYIPRFGTPKFGKVANNSSAFTSKTSVNAFGKQPKAISSQHKSLCGKDLSGEVNNTIITEGNCNEIDGDGEELRSPHVPLFQKRKHPYEKKSAQKNSIKSGLSKRGIVESMVVSAASVVTTNQHPVLAPAVSGTTVVTTVMGDLHRPYSKQTKTALEKDDKTKTPVKKKPKIDENVDMRKLAGENKLSKVNTATLIHWLKNEGIHCKSKDKKGDLVLKVYTYLGINQAEP